MWDRPDILNRLASALCAVSFLLAAFAAAHYAMRLPAFALREVRVTNVLAHVTPDQVETVVVRELKGNFFTLDLELARAGFEKLPWVRKTAVRRQWPDRLEVAIEEHVALGRWGDAGLVNTYGERFSAAYGTAATVGESGAALPLFVGPPGSEKEIAIQYGYFKRSLGTLGLVPVQVQVSARRAWQVRVARGITLQLGREDIESRLERFIAVYARTVGRLDRKLTYIDLRYSNGFAVGIPELGQPQQGEPRQHKPARAAG